jgi:hypothetical protein
MSEGISRLRVKAHPGFVGAYNVERALAHSAVKDDKPAGREAMLSVADNPRSPGAMRLKREPGWQDIKFVFPKTQVGTRISWVRWSERKQSFERDQGLVYFPWREDFRTVHD